MGVGSLTYRNDNGNTFCMSMVESMFDFLHRVINNGQFSEVSRSSPLKSFQSRYFQLGHFKSLSAAFLVVVVACLFIILFRGSLPCWLLIH